jgi:signal peptidase I
VQETERESGAEGSVGGAQERRGTLSTVWDWTKPVAVVLLLFLAIRTFVVEAFRIPTASMENTLMVGDFLLVDKAVYGAEIPGTDLHLPAFAEPRRGDVIVFNPPPFPARYWVKRLVGVPGDTLSMRNKQLFLDGRPVVEPYARYSDRRGDVVNPDMLWQSNYLAAGTSSRYHPSRDNWGPLVVPPDSFFVLGDNRDDSEDSRYLGFIPRSAIRGRPWFVYFSFDPTAIDRIPWLHDVRWGRIGQEIR